jgi:hypothetical protein
MVAGTGLARLLSGMMHKNGHRFFGEIMLMLTQDSCARFLTLASDSCVNFNTLASVRHFSQPSSQKGDKITAREVLRPRDQFEVAGHGGQLPI